VIDPLPDEPSISINGRRLTEAQAMTVRVAVGSFEMTLQGNGLGEDETGRAICAGYLARIAEINAMMQQAKT